MNLGLSEAEEAQYIAAIRAGGIARERATHALNLAFRGYLPQQRQKLKLSQEDAIDCYTDALVAVCEQIANGRFGGESRLSTYFFRIFSNRCIDKLRSRTTNFSKAQQEWSDAFAHLPDRAQNFMQRFLDQERLEAVKGHLRALGERCQQILWYSAYWGYSPKEIAEKMKFSSAKSASSQRYQCLQQLKKRLEASEHDV
ncbi:MAG: sigma-70 family RNA polymerase sigma factor [Bacteroidota bacterium]